MNKVELWANTVTSVATSFGRDLDEAIAEPGGLTWYEAAECIVEPENIDLDYFDWMESDMENWANWIKQILGEKWGTIASQVVAEGY